MLTIPFFSFKRSYKIAPHVLIVLDGFGVAPPTAGNAISLAKTPNLDYFREHFPHGTLLASGEAVGLPANEVGNTEVGHLTIGAGRVILQDLKRINVSIEKGSFYDNRAFIDAANHVRTHNSKLHILGLVSTGKVHSSIDHLYALLQFCKKESLNQVYVHAFTDGRDAGPKEGLAVIEKLQNDMQTMRVGSIASVSGRYYSMDRDRRWPRIEKSYRAIVEGMGIQTQSASDAVKSAYARGQTDEFIEPTLVVPNGLAPVTIDDNDAVIFFNYRIDRAKQLTLSIVAPDFENLKSMDLGYDPKTNKKIDTKDVGTTFVRNKKPANVFFVTMTEYQKGMPVSAIAFAPELVAVPMSEVLAREKLSHMHMAESEKERFVSYFFNGQREDAYPGENKLIVPSPKVATYDLKPEMSLPDLVKEIIKQLRKDTYHFFIVNFANADMVGHTGNLKAAIKAIECIDKNLGDLYKEISEHNGTMYITADHGNAEEMLSFPGKTYFFTTSEGSLSTDHTSNPVPFMVINKNYYDSGILVEKGELCDVAPTILSHMGISVPAEMTGKNRFVLPLKQ